MSPRVWRADPSEAEIVARLLVGFRDELGRDWPSANAFLASVERLIERTDTEYLIGAPHDDAPPAGVVQLRYRFGIWYAAEDCHLEDLFVETAARRSGLGSALVAAAIERARERGCARVELDVNEGNAPARALYERHGFTNDGSAFGEHRGRDLFMRRRLGD